MPAPDGPLCALPISTQAFDPSRYLRQHEARCPRKKGERTTRSPVRLRVNIRNRFIPANIPNKIQNTRSLIWIQNLLCAIPHRQPRTQSKKQKHEPQPNVRLLVIGPRTGGRFICRTASGTATVGDGTDVGVAAFVGAAAASGTAVADERTDGGAASLAGARHLTLRFPSVTANHPLHGFPRLLLPLLFLRDGRRRYRRGFSRGSFLRRLAFLLGV